MEKQQGCEATVVDGFHVRQCGNLGKYEEQGKRYCKAHLPANRKARRHEANQQIEQQLAKLRHSTALRAAEGEVLDAAIAWLMTGMGDDACLRMATEHYMRIKSEGQKQSLTNPASS